MVSSLKVIVPEEKGMVALAGISGVIATLIKPDQSVPALAADADVLVVGPAEKPHEVNQALRQISQLPQLKLLQTLGQGVEQWDGLLPPELTVSTARGAHGGSTAELVLAQLLCLVRELPLYAKNQQAHRWQGHRTRTLLGMHVLVYGAGDLGLNIHSRLLPFGAQVTMVGSHSREGVIDLKAAHALLPTSQVVIMALPFTKTTERIVNAAFLALLPDKAIFINAGRGGLVETSALCNELKAGRLEAGLDVVTPEPLPADHPLWEAPGLLLTPHVGGNTLGADDRAWQVVVEQIRDYMDSRE